MNPIEIKGLTKVYRGKRGKRVEALTDLDLTIDQGEVFGFLGPNGAGKSTTIKTIMGLINPSSGEARVFGTPVSDISARARIGYLPENPSFYDFLTARQYLRFVGTTFDMEASLLEREMERVLRLLELEHAADRPIRGFSKGMVQRLGLAQVLIHDPDLYILDEPMSGLDPVGRALVKKIISDLKLRGKTVFFSTHITADVEAVCDRVGVVAGGRLRSVENVADLLRSGIREYVVRITGPGTLQELFAAYEVTIVSTGKAEVSVPPGEFNDFMGKVIGGGFAVEAVETRREDLEAYFLETVREAGQ